MAEHEHDDQEQMSPEAAAVEQARSESPEEMKANILAFARQATDVLGSGLTEERPVDDEPDPELVELGKQRYEANKARQAEQPPPLSDEARELLEEATTRELEDGYGEIERGLRHAQRDRQSFLDVVRNALEQEPGIDDLLEQFGANDVADLENSDTFQQLDPEEQRQVMEEIASNPVISYADEVLSTLRAGELAEKQATLGEATRQAQETNQKLWLAKVERGLGAAGLNDHDWQGAQDEISGLQDVLAQGGPALMEQLVSDFDPSGVEHLELFEELLQPLASRGGDDPYLAPAAAVLAHLVQETARTMNSRKAGARILEASGGHLPMLDHERQEYIENWVDQPAKAVTDMGRIQALLRAGPAPNRTGAQVGKSIQRENLSVRAELEKARNQHDKAWTREQERRRAGQFPGR